MFDIGGQKVITCLRRSHWAIISVSLAVVPRPPSDVMESEKSPAAGFFLACIGTLANEYCCLYQITLSSFFEYISKQHATLCRYNVFYALDGKWNIIHNNDITL